MILRLSIFFMFSGPGGTWSDAGHSSWSGTWSDAGHSGYSGAWTWTWTNSCSGTWTWNGAGPSGCTGTGTWTCAGPGCGPGCGQKMMMSAMSGIWLRPLTIGTVLIAGSESIWAASKLGSRTSNHFLRIIRERNSWMVHTARIRLWLLLLPLGWIQSEYVEQDGGDICHHNERNEHDEP